MLDNGLLMAEINPLITTPDGEFLALDGKVEIDDNFAELNPNMETFYQQEHATPEENKARDAGLSFVKLSGWVGLMVNGAGLAMATMDMLNFSKLPASNFLDLGGAADQKRMEIALELPLWGHPGQSDFHQPFRRNPFLRESCTGYEGRPCRVCTSKAHRGPHVRQGRRSRPGDSQKSHVDNLHMAPTCKRPSQPWKP